MKVYHEKAFTLAEVLITLGIVGVVASITIPTLIKNTQDAEFKTAYKKAYSDATNVWNSMVNDNVVTERSSASGVYDTNAALANFITFMGYFKTTLVCDTDNTKCWDSTGEKLNDAIPYNNDYAFIDSSGHAWSSAWAAYAGERIFVDTNGFKGPNHFGKDRWQFYPVNQGWCQDTSSGSCYGAGISVKLIPSSDSGYTVWGCQYPPCSPKSWLYQ